MNDYDSSWKDIIEDLFEDFLLFFAPDLFAEVDFEQGYRFLDKELSQIFPGQGGKKILDKLIEVGLKNGKEKWILVHVEIQGYYEEEFSERMFKYFYRVYDKFQKKIFALAIFSDSYKGFKPNKFKYSFYDTKLIYQYRTYKILEHSEMELLKRDNPFALAVLAGLQDYM